MFSRKLRQERLTIDALKEQSNELDFLSYFGHHGDLALDPKPFLFWPCILGHIHI